MKVVSYILWSWGTAFNHLFMLRKLTKLFCICFLSPEDVLMQNPTTYSISLFSPLKLNSRSHFVLHSILSWVSVSFSLSKRLGLIPKNYKQFYGTPLNEMLWWRTYFLTDFAKPVQVINIMTCYNWNAFTSHMHSRKEVTQAIRTFIFYAMVSLLGNTLSFTAISLWSRSINANNFPFIGILNKPPIRPFSITYKNGNLKTSKPTDSRGLKKTPLNQIYIALLWVPVSLADLGLYGPLRINIKNFSWAWWNKGNSGCHFWVWFTYNVVSLRNEHFHKKFISHFYTNIHRYFLIMK